MNSRRPFALLALAAALLLPANPAQAWGRLGHRLVADLAWDGMSPAARRQALVLLQGEPEPSLAGVASWADDLRASDPGLGRRSVRWHYVNVAENDCHYDAPRHCPGGNCVVGAIEAQTAILADPGRSRAERLQALKFVVHFIGDVHQPLHAAYARDKGGNTVQVNLDGKGSNLHALWDSGLLDAGGLDEAGWLARLRSTPQAVMPGAAPAAASWAEASCRVAMQPGFYPPRSRLGQDYVMRWTPVAEARLRDAGHHLAATLNQALAAR